jgi:hypothetical protein
MMRSLSMSFRMIRSESRGARPDRPIVVDGVTLKGPDGKPLRVHTDPMEISPDGRWFYFGTLEGPWSRNAFSAPTEILRDVTASEATISATVVDLGDVGGNTDGIVTDAVGNLYITDVTRGGIVKYDPRKNTMALSASDGEFTGRTRQPSSLAGT